MTTKSDCSFLTNKKQLFASNSSHITENADRYSNLNLNQNYKLIPVQSYSKPLKDKNSDSTVSDNYEEKRKSSFCNESLKTSNFASLNGTVEEEVKKSSNKNNASNSSTLSLYIAAHESSFDTETDKNKENMEKFGSIKKQKSFKHAFTGASTFFNQNPFEFPRQQKDEILEPEVSQFKASQQLLNPNEASVSDQQDNESKTSTSSSSLSSLEQSNPSMASLTQNPPAIANFDPRTLDPAALSFITAIITAVASANTLSLHQILASAPPHLQAASSPAFSAHNTTSSSDASTQQNLLSSLNLSTASSNPTTTTTTTTDSSPNSSFLLPYIIPKPSGGTTKKRINRGRAFKAHKGIYNVVIDGQVRSAGYPIDTLRTELIKKQSELPPIIVEGENVCEKLSLTIDLLPHLNNPSHCGAVVAGHIFPRDFFIDHILRDVEGNVKAAKGFINHSNREPLSREASKLFFDVLYHFGGVIIEPHMLESWMWVARKGVNDRGNTSKSGRGVRYFVRADYVPVLQNDLWAPEKSHE
uniref:Uncharacterized protein n=1 Tax=Panagrolaimus sp. PS1159 TaxID=55785 RepID=A0AC35G2Y7_9BILA